MIVEKFIPGCGKNHAFSAMMQMTEKLEKGVSYADMIRFRLAGGAVSECQDIYYVAHRKGEPACRLWTGWGKHADAIGNWGNFFTREEFRGQGVGKKVLDAWKRDFEKRKRLPPALFCSAATEELTELYSRYGFRPAIEGQKKGSLYCPLGKSPECFSDFYRKYYTPCDRLIHRRASVGYRHEIDLLLRFALKNEGIPFGIDGARSMEEALLYHPHRAGMFFTPEGHCVGWSFDKNKQIYPAYECVPVTEE